MRIAWSLFAIEDREAVFEYIEADNAQAAVRMDEAIEAQVELLAGTPEIGRPGRVEGTRELVIQRTPYVVAYRIESKTVRVLRVLHGAQLWPDKLEAERSEGRVR